MNASAIHSAVVEVRYADPPQEGRKQATLKTPAGEVYGMKPELLGLFRRGNRYRIDYTERAYNGRTYRTIVKCEPEATPSNSTNSESPKGAGDASTGEADFVSRCLAASIAACQVGRSKEDLVDRIRVLRAAYREGMA